MVNIELSDKNESWVEYPIKKVNVDIKLMEIMDRYWIDIRWLLDKNDK